MSGKKINLDSSELSGNSAHDGIITSQPSNVPQMQASYAAVHPLKHNPHSFYAAMMDCLGAFCGFMGSIPLCCCCFPNPYKKVDQGNVGLISRFGQYYKSVDPGLVKVNVITEDLIKVDVKIQITEIPRQAIMTKDNVYIHIDSIIYWHIINPYQAVYGVTDVRKALIERTQTTLRHTLGARVLQDCIENREAIAYEIKEIIDEPAHAWGVKVESILIRDIVFSSELQASLSSAAQQKRIGESKVILAQAEVDSAKLMRQAAEILNSPAAMQIRYLETMASMSKAAGTKVIFMPTNSSFEGLPNSVVASVSPISQLLLYSFIILSVVFSVKAESKVIFSYDGKTGPAFWHLLPNSSSICIEGRRQSPINLFSKIDLIKKFKPPCDVRVQNIRKAELAHTGNTLEVALSKEEEGAEGGGEEFLPAQFTVENETYKLLQFHFHTPSEHRIDGKHLDVEMHLVFKSPSEKISVAAVFFNVDHKGMDNKFLKPILQRPPKPNEAIEIRNINLKQIFRNINNIQKPYSYTGSLTTPPCTEGVLWWINDKHIQPISHHQRIKLRDAIGFNSRYTQDRFKEPEPESKSDSFLKEYEKDHSKKPKPKPKKPESKSDSFLKEYEKDHSKKPIPKPKKPKSKSESFLKEYEKDHSKKPKSKPKKPESKSEIFLKEYKKNHPLD
ncbi:40893_t:CDS:10 [Gigaspora margarita]|uniref:40893_t:CDS:1 n=1 Tax=Gigaspora margarita TaxID=4874 RepID=A0ABN7V0F3_GIGMA|nr:40893_t:CDS:10 [Gigaspora margarita]